MNVEKKEDYYSVLRVHKDATQEDIQKSYKKLSSTFHPDKAASLMKLEFPELNEEELRIKTKKKEKELQQEFIKINEAYQVLSDPKRRKEYNQYGKVDATGKPSPKAIAIVRFRELLLSSMANVQSLERDNIVDYIQFRIDEIQESLSKTKVLNIKQARKVTIIKNRLTGPEHGLHINIFKEEYQQIRHNIKEVKYQKKVISEVENILNDYFYRTDEKVQLTLF